MLPLPLNVMKIHNALGLLSMMLGMVLTRQ
jgi:hypothetical protein